MLRIRSMRSTLSRLDGERERKSGVRWLLYELRVRELGQIRDRLDDADLEQEVGRILAEGRVLAGEEFLVGLPVLPAQVLGRFPELLTRLLHVRAHDLVGLGLVGLDHFEGVE